MIMIGQLAAAAVSALLIAGAALAATAPAPAPAPAPAASSPAPAKPAAAPAAGASKAPFAGLSGDSDKPVHITAETQQADFQAETVTYSGNVRAEQGKMTLRADKIVADAPKNHLTKVTASGDVVITSEDATARAPLAVYDVVAHTILLTGDVVLTQGQNTMRGTALLVDTVAGTAKLTATGSATGRVDGVLLPNSPPAKPKPAAKTPDVKKS